MYVIFLFYFLIEMENDGEVCSFFGLILWIYVDKIKYTVKTREFRKIGILTLFKNIRFRYYVIFICYLFLF